MITVFPDLCPDEIVCSAGGRYQDLFDFPHQITATMHFFGRYGARSIFDLPRNLEFLVSALPPGHQYTVDTLILNHTLFPFYQPFLTPERASGLQQEMIQGRREERNVKSENLPRRIMVPRFFLFCPICVLEDRDQHGQCYFHRSHHAPGVRICYKHAVWLEETSITTSGRRAFVSAEKSIRNVEARSVDRDDTRHADLFAYATDVAWLLENNGAIPDPSTLKHKYLHAMIDRGYASPAGNIKTRSLTVGFVQRYDHQFLSAMDAQIEGKYRRNWVALIAKSRQTQHPIRHLLFMRFLGYSAEQFFAQELEHRPFGAGPWPCLNPICPYYGQRVILMVYKGFTRTIARRPLGTFVCLHCGFTYSRAGPDKSARDITKHTRVIVYGNLWDTCLIRLWNDPAVPMKQIVETLGVGHDTVHRQVVRLGLPKRSDIDTNLQIAYPPTQPQTLEELIEEYRGKWLAVQRNHPNAGVKALQQMFPTIHRVLDRFDFDWLSSHKPPQNDVGQSEILDT